MARNRNEGEDNTMSALGAELTQAEIDELLAGQRAHGDYDQWLDEFVASDATAVRVDRENGLLAGKTVEKIYTGLNNAKKRMRDNKLVHPDAQNVVVARRGKDDNAYVAVINKDKMQAAA